MQNLELLGPLWAPFVKNFGPKIEIISVCVNIYENN